MHGIILGTVDTKKNKRVLPFKKLKREEHILYSIEFICPQIFSPYLLFYFISKLNTHTLWEKQKNHIKIIHHPSILTEKEQIIPAYVKENSLVCCKCILIPNVF